ncbi:DNA-binding protein [Edwardsiella tarda]|uniref:DNA-binding protein n=1 Tax=Edwardsiella tarda TaxID=636 RepID=UPI0024449443|nr:DNA-binding protein [Edwardsiella tarda]WGE29440.1 DNA-binding protein [Edwardsiella tarda]
MTSAKNKQPRVRAPNTMPEDYPYWDEFGNPLIKETIAEHAARTGRHPRTLQWHCDVGNIPVIQVRKGAKRYVNLYALYRQAKQGAEQFLKNSGY